MINKYTKYTTASKWTKVTMPVNQAITYPQSAEINQGACLKQVW